MNTIHTSSGSQRTDEPNHALPLIFAILFFLMLTLFPAVSRKAVSDSLMLCYTKLIPSLFLFIVAGDVLFSCGAAELIGVILGAPFEKLFGISRNGVGAFLMGLVCGLPLGGKYAIALFEKGLISKSDCERLIGISNNAGMGFVVVGIGYGFWGSTAFGWLLYVCEIISSITVGICFKRKSLSVSVAPKSEIPTENKLSSIICSSVLTASYSMLQICGFVIFFSALSAFISELFVYIGAPPILSLVPSAILEISSGCEALHSFSLSNEPVACEIAKALTFFSVGFSGISAHFQLSSFALKSNIRMKHYYCQKLICGIICMILGMAAVNLLNFNI